MWTLGFDSASDTVTAALLKDGRLYNLYTSSSATTHSTTLLPAVMRLISAAGIEICDLSLIGCSAGPGSFTGIRIGTSTAKGLASPHGIPCVGVSSLEAMAYMFEEISGVVCPALNARRGNVYTALFMSDGRGSITRLTEDSLVSVCEMAEFIEGSLSHETVQENRLFVTGDSNEAVCASLSADGSITLGSTPELLSSPSAYGVARCALSEYYKTGRDANAFMQERLSPIYLRKSQAERELEEKKSAK